MPISLFNYFKKEKDKENVTPSRNAISEDVREEPFVVSRVGEIRGYKWTTVDEYGQPSYEILSDITLIPGNLYAIYIVPNQMEDIGEYVYNGLTRVKPFGSNIEKANSLIFTCVNNCKDMVIQGDFLQIGIKEELHRYKFKSVAKGGRRKRKTFRKRRSRKTRH